MQCYNNAHNVHKHKHKKPKHKNVKLSVKKKNYSEHANVNTDKNTYKKSKWFEGLAEGTIFKYIFNGV